MKWRRLRCSVTQSCPTLCDSVDRSLPGSSVRGILQARILEWVAISSSKDLSDPEMEPGSLTSPPPASRFFTTEPPWKRGDGLSLVSFGADFSEAFLWNHESSGKDFTRKKKGNKLLKTRIYEQVVLYLTLGLVTAATPGLQFIFYPQDLTNVALLK